MNLLIPSERVRGGLGLGKKITTPARIAILKPLVGGTQKAGQQS